MHPGDCPLASVRCQPAWCLREAGAWHRTGGLVLLMGWRGGREEEGATASGAAGPETAGCNPSNARHFPGVAARASPRPPARQECGAGPPRVGTGTGSVGGGRAGGRCPPTAPARVGCPRVPGSPRCCCFPYSSHVLAAAVESNLGGMKEVWGGLGKGDLSPWSSGSPQAPVTRAVCRPCLWAEHWGARIELWGLVARCPGDNRDPLRLQPWVSPKMGDGAGGDS